MSSEQRCSQGGLDAVDGINERPERTHIPENSILEFRYQSEHPPVGVVHDVRRPVVLASVIGYKPHSYRLRAVGIARSVDFSRLRSVRLEPHPEMVWEEWQFGLHSIGEFLQDLGLRSSRWMFIS
jgi:hypothetical protein